jgi:hypothetical protein
MKKIFFISVLLIFLSCNSVKIKRIEMDYTQDLIGKIKQIEMSSFRYPTNKKDTVVHEEKSIAFFDKKNKIIKQIDYYPKFIDETYFNYKKDLLESTVSKIDKRSSKIEYKYDDKKNIVEYSQLENDTLYFRKTSVYDKQNNRLEETYSHPKYKNNNSVDEFTNDYKNRKVTIQSFDENKKPKNYYALTHFNKKGYIIKNELIYTDSKKREPIINTLEYDKRGNLTRRFGLDKDGKPKDVFEYKNTYDEKGNISTREKYSKEKLIEKTVYKITYR